MAQQLHINDRTKNPARLSGDDCARLLKLPLFEGLSETEFYHLIGDAWIDDRPAGSLIFLHGDPADSFYAVLDGWVKLYRSTADGNESIIAVLSKGESFAEAAVFEEGTYPVSAAAVEDARLLVLPAKPFLDKVMSERRLVAKMMASMSRRLRQLVHQVEDLSLKSSVERLAGYIAGLCEMSSGAAVVSLPIDKALIARHLGMQPETLSRSFARLRARGIVSDGSRVSIPDIIALKRLADAGNIAESSRACRAG